MNTFEFQMKFDWFRSIIDKKLALVQVMALHQAGDKQAITWTIVDHAMYKIL